MSVAMLRRSRNGESSTQADKQRSFEARRMAVDAPMERPQRPMEVTRPDFRKCLIATPRSFSS